MNWADWAVSVFALSGFLSALFAVEKGIAFKQSIVAVSFVAIYFLTRVFVRNLSDIKKVLPFFLSSSAVVLIYGIWQNVRFAKRLESFEVMPGRPNATFTEADWLGMYVTFLIAILFSIIFYLSKKYPKKEGGQISEFFNTRNLLLLFAHCFNVLLLVVLIITVARSAWLGAGVVAIIFLLLVLFFSHSNPPVGGEESRVNSTSDIIPRFLGKLGMTTNFKEFLRQAGFVLFTVLLAIGSVKLFNLSSFELFNRAQSTTSGLQEITISCGKDSAGVPQKIGNVDELVRYGCRHINLEEMESEKKHGRFVSTVFRLDPNV
ncbi:MAG: hypothetical protein ACD_11C00128G0001, partial [uncultured bacterium]